LTCSREQRTNTFRHIILRLHAALQQTLKMIACGIDVGAVSTAILGAGPLSNSGISAIVGDDSTTVDLRAPCALNGKAVDVFAPLIGFTKEQDDRFFYTLV